MSTSDKVIQYYEEQVAPVKLDHKGIFETCRKIAIIIADDLSEVSSNDVAEKLGNNIWNYCRTILAKRGFNFMKENGFKLLLREIRLSKKESASTGGKISH